MLMGGRALLQLARRAQALPWAVGLALLQALQTLLVGASSNISAGFYSSLVDGSESRFLSVLAYACMLYASVAFVASATDALGEMAALYWRVAICRTSQRRYCSSYGFLWMGQADDGAFRPPMQLPIHTSCMDAHSQKDGPAARAEAQSHKNGVAPPPPSGEECITLPEPPPETDVPGAGVDTPDQRLTSDLDLATSTAAVVVQAISGIPLSLVVYGTMAARVFGSMLPLVAGAAYFLCGAAAQRVLMGTAARLTFRQEALEGRLRSAHARLRSCADALTQVAAAPYESAHVDALLCAAAANCRTLVLVRWGLGALTKAVDYGGALLCYGCVAVAVMGGGWGPHQHPNDTSSSSSSSSNSSWSNAMRNIGIVGFYATEAEPPAPTQDTAAHHLVPPAPMFGALAGIAGAALLRHTPGHAALALVILATYTTTTSNTSPAAQPSSHFPPGAASSSIPPQADSPSDHHAMQFGSMHQQVAQATASNTHFWSPRMLANVVSGLWMLGNGPGDAPFAQDTTPGDVAARIAKASFLLLTFIYSLTSLLDLSGKVSTLLGTASRVAQLNDALDAHDQQQQQQQQQESCHCAGGTAALVVRGLSIWAPVLCTQESTSSIGNEDQGLGLGAMPPGQHGYPWSKQQTGDGTISVGVRLKKEMRRACVYAAMGVRRGIVWALPMQRDGQGAARGVGWGIGRTLLKLQEGQEEGGQEPLLQQTHAEGGGCGSGEVEGERGCEPPSCPLLREDVCQGHSEQLQQGRRQLLPRQHQQQQHQQEQQQGPCLRRMQQGRQGREGKLKLLLANLDLQLQPGQRLLVVGPDGCGKTSLVRGLLGLWRLHTGHVSISAPIVPFFSSLLKELCSSSSSSSSPSTSNSNLSSDTSRDPHAQPEGTHFQAPHTALTIDHSDVSHPSDSADCSRHPSSTQATHQTGPDSGNGRMQTSRRSCSSSQQVKRGGDSRAGEGVCSHGRPTEAGRGGGVLVLTQCAVCAPGLTTLRQQLLYPSVDAAQGVSLPSAAAVEEGKEAQEQQPQQQQGWCRLAGLGPEGHQAPCHHLSQHWQHRHHYSPQHHHYHHHQEQQQQQQQQQQQWAYSVLQAGQHSEHVSDEYMAAVLCAVGLGGLLGWEDGPGAAAVAAAAAATATAAAPATNSVSVQQQGRAEAGTAAAPATVAATSSESVQQGRAAAAAAAAPANSSGCLQQQGNEEAAAAAGAPAATANSSKLLQEGIGAAAATRLEEDGEAISSQCVLPGIEEERAGVEGMKEVRDEEAAGCTKMGLSSFAGERWEGGLRLLCSRVQDWSSILSPGQLQRLAVARALCARPVPTLLVLDEALGSVPEQEEVALHQLLICVLCAPSEGFAKEVSPHPSSVSDRSRKLHVNSSQAGDHDSSKAAGVSQPEPQQPIAGQVWRPSALPALQHHSALEPAHCDAQRPHMPTAVITISHRPSSLRPLHDVQLVMHGGSQGGWHLVPLTQ